MFYIVVKGTEKEGRESIEEEMETNIEEAVKEATQAEQLEQPEENVLLTRQRELVMYLKVSVTFIHKINVMKQVHNGIP